MERARASVFFLLLLSTLGESRGGGREESLYDTLGVPRDAGQKEIRAAYKRLAREWHPDKNKSPRAQEKIMEINKAYEVLSEEKSRRHYDMTGETDPSPSRQQGHAHNQGGFTFFQAGNGHFQFHFGGGHTHQREDLITTHYFQRTVLPESGIKLWLLNFFSDFCMNCGEVARIWDELREEMESNGIGMGSVHASHQYSVSSHCGVDRVPAIVAVVGGRVFTYHGNLQTRSIRNFVKNTLPSWTITELSSENIDSFIADSIELNRPRIILFSPHSQSSLLYKAVAFSNHATVAGFGFATTERGSGSSAEFLGRFNVSWGDKKLFIFKEYPIPSSSIEGPQLTGDTLKSALKGLRLHLPRLSSPHVLDDICRDDGSLCLILMVYGLESYNDSITDAFRSEAIRLHSNDGARFSLAYIDRDRQSDFISVFELIQGSSKNCANGHKSHHVLILRRRKAGFHCSYDWFDKYCGSRDDFNSLLALAVRTSLKTCTTSLPNLKDEFAPGLLSRVWSDLVDLWYRAYDYATINSQMLSLLIMMCGTAGMLCCMSLIGAGQSEEEQKERRKPTKKRQHQGEDRPTLSPDIPLINSQHYQHYIEDAHRGSIAILLLTDSVETQEIFSEISHGYKQKRVKFFRGSLKGAKYWLQEVLEGSNMETEEKKKRLGLFRSDDGMICVLALFGAREQFAIFPETLENGDAASTITCLEGERCALNGSRNQQEGESMTETLMDSFGFEDDGESGSQGHRYTGGGDDDMDIVGSRESEVIENRLRVWLERLGDGSLKRYSVDHWPPWQQS